MRVDIGTKIIEYQINYSRRKTMSITVKPDGTIRVAAPKGTAAKTVQDWVASKSKWIAAKMAEVEMANRQIAERSFQSGEEFLYLGRPMRLELVNDPQQTRTMVRGREGTIQVTGPDCSPAAVKAALETWYRWAAGRYIGARVQNYQIQVGRKPGRITIREQKTRWGSCSARGNLNFNWRIMMAPPEIIDYLVVHELCHLVHLNHSPVFWNLVGSIMPDYKVRKEWLGKNGHQLRS